MKIACGKCNKVLTEDLFQVKLRKGCNGLVLNGKHIWEYVPNPYEEYHEGDRLVRGDMLFVRFYVVRSSGNTNNKYCDDVPAQIVRGNPQMLVVGLSSIIDGVIPPYYAGCGCCNHSMGEPLACECGHHVGEMYLDCWEDKSVRFTEKKISRMYGK